ncbi:MAG: hypothetical protein HY035_06535 [Nitrospirae bacterium]|nr:hypothetical protein [Nitrospirota bacterium]
MGRILDVLKEKGITYYQSERYNLDSFYFDNYQDEGELFEKTGIFEDENKQGKIIKVEPKTTTSLFKYFLDGSRRTYRIAEAEIGDKLVPIVAGQIGCGVCKRLGNEIKTHQIKRKNCLVLYNRISDDDYKDIKNRIEQTGSIAVDRYEYSSNMEIRPENKAIARIQDIMYDMEIDLLEEMTKKNILKHGEMLAIDGSLQFSDIRDERYFYNVVGISKTFNPNLKNMLKSKNKSIGTLLPKLEYRERTPVFKYNQTGENQRFRQTIGAWYLRIRPRNQVKNPLDGIVKIEKIAVADKEKEDGFETGLINNISSSILLERNVTCYGNDSRWASHIYPIYLTEIMIKNSFLSDIYFLNIF